MSEYIPTTDEIRKTYDDGRGWQQMGHARYVPGEFDLWLEQFRAEAKAEALREAAEGMDAYDATNPPPADDRWTCDLGYYGEAAWLRNRADLIEAGSDDE